MTDVDSGLAAPLRRCMSVKYRERHLYQFITRWVNRVSYSANTLVALPCIALFEQRNG